MYPNHHIKEHLSLTPEVIKLLNKYHYLPTIPRGTKRVYELIWKDKVIGAAIWGTPIGRNINGNTLELKRFILKPKLRKGTASWFLSRCIQILKAQDVDRLITYADPAQGHKGIIYKATNWKELGPQPLGSPWLEWKGLRVNYRNKHYPKYKQLLNAYNRKEIKIQRDIPKIKFEYILRR